MMLRIAAPRSLAASPLLLLALEKPDSYTVEFFLDHDASLAGLAGDKYEILCSGYSECDRVPPESRPNRIATFVWGLSAIMVRDRDLQNLDAVARSPSARAALVLPFAGSPVDLQVRALLRKLYPGNSLSVVNAPLPQTMQDFTAGKISAAVLPEPMASVLELSGKAYRLADLSTIHAEVTGESRSPQVSLFVKNKNMISGEFLAELRRCIRELSSLTQTQLEYIEGHLHISRSVLAHALAHVLFDLPPQAESSRREKIYTELSVNDVVSELARDPIAKGFHN